MKTSIDNTLIVAFIGLVLGISIAMILGLGKYYHGYNSNLIRKTTYKNTKTGECSKFDIHIVKCNPNSHHNGYKQ